MSNLDKKRQVLEILIENLDNPDPQVVPSEMIADKLEMNVKETCQLVKVMHGMGVLISDMEGRNSLITLEGMNCAAP